jgi:hypothetical protein
MLVVSAYCSHKFHHIQHHHLLILWITKRVVFTWYPIQSTTTVTYHIHSHHQLVVICHATHCQPGFVNIAYDVVHTWYLSRPSNTVRRVRVFGERSVRRTLFDFMFAMFDVNAVFACVRVNFLWHLCFLTGHGQHVRGN